MSRLLREILGARGRIASIGLPALVSQAAVAAWGVVVILVARIIPKEAYAAYSVARSIEFFAALLGGGFVLQALLKFAAEGDGRREKELLNAASLMTAVLSVAGALLILAGGPLIEAFYGDLELEGLPLVLALVVLLEGLCGIPKNALLAAHRTRTVMWGDLASFAARAGTVGWLALERRLSTPHQIFTAQAASSLVCLLILAALGGRFTAAGAGTSLARVRQVMSYSLVTLGTTIASFIYSWTDILMLGKMAPEAETAAYGVCRSLAAFAMVLNSAANVVLIPLASRMSSQGRGGILRRTWQGVLVVEAVLLPFVLLSAAFARPLLHLIFSGRYDYGWPILTMLLLTSLVRPPGSLFSATGAGVGRPGYSLQSVIITALLNVLLNAILIPSHGALGAAIATAVSLSSGSLAVVLLVTRHLAGRRAPAD